MENVTLSPPRIALWEQQEGSRRLMHAVLFAARSQAASEGER